MTVSIELTHDTDVFEVSDNGELFVYLTHSELADLYIALTDYYADTKEN